MRRGARVCPNGRIRVPNQQREMAKRSPVSDMTVEKVNCDFPAAAGLCLTGRNESFIVASRRPDLATHPQSNEGIHDSRWRESEVSLFRRGLRSFPL